MPPQQAEGLGSGAPQQAEGLGSGAPQQAEGLGSGAPPASGGCGERSSPASGGSGERSPLASAPAPMDYTTKADVDEILITRFFSIKNGSRPASARDAFNLEA